MAGPVCRGGDTDILYYGAAQGAGDDGRTPRFLRTLHGQGYRFVAAVEMQEPLPADTVPHTLAPPGEREGGVGAVW